MLVSPDSLDAADRTLMSFTIRTPGAENERRTYLLEMDLRGWGEIASEVHHVPVTWSRTSKDTLTSIVELGGTGDKGPGHWLRITRGNEGDAFSRRFRWLSAIAL